MAESDQHGSDASSEVERLRAEVAALRGDLPGGAPERGEGGGPSARSGWWRPAVMTVLLVLVGLLAPLAVVAVWAHDEIGDTDRYVETITPLASDPAVQAAVANRVTDEIFKRLDVKGVTEDAITALQSRGLPAAVSSGLSALASPLTDEVRGFVHTKVVALVRSEEFRQAWAEANRAAHTQMIGVLTGQNDKAVKVEGNTVSVNLATIINAVKAKLHDSGLTLVDRIPTVNAQFTIFQSTDITKAQAGFRLLRPLARGLPILALILLGLAIAVARSRRRALLAGAVVVAGSMLVLGIALNAFRVIYLRHIPSDVLPHDAAGAAYDQLTHFIRISLREVLGLFLAIALVAWMSGPAPAPAAVRRGANQLLDRVRNRSDRAGLRTGGFGVALWQYRTQIRVGVLGAALLVYVMTPHPAAAFTLTILAVAAAVLVVVELIARPPATQATAPG